MRNNKLMATLVLAMTLVTTPMVVGANSGEEVSSNVITSTSSTNKSDDEEANSDSNKKPETNSSGTNTPSEEADDNQEGNDEEENKIITPSGNLTLVDDVLEEGDGSTQFVTLQSKDGNYFYLIIDRTGKQENVHFLNLIDEADLMALTDGDVVVKEEPKVDSPIEDMLNEEVKEEEPVEEKESSPMGVLLTIGILIAGGVLYFKKFKDADKNKVKLDFTTVEGQDEDDEEYLFDDATDEEIDDELNS